MNEERHLHSSCIQGTSLYVCGGLDQQHNPVSIERLADANLITLDESSGSWEYLNISAAFEVERPLMMPLNQHEILIIGSEQDIGLRQRIIDLEQMTRTRLGSNLDLDDEV